MKAMGLIGALKDWRTIWLVYLESIRMTGGLAAYLEPEPGLPGAGGREPALALALYIDDCPGAATADNITIRIRVPNLFMVWPECGFLPGLKI